MHSWIEAGLPLNSKMCFALCSQVSTLDGRLTALNTEGSELWSVDTHPGPMLSSTLSKLDQKSSPVRLIPSLAGGLYKFDGEVVEPVPLDAEALLKTSFQFSKDSALKTTMSGGKEKRTYGLDLATGRVRYECTIDGCKTGNDGRYGQRCNRIWNNFFHIKTSNTSFNNDQPR